MAKVDLSPPWILFTDKGKPQAIMPAGRPGDVAVVAGMSMRTAQRIVRAANTGATLTERVKALGDATCVIALRTAMRKLLECCDAP